jgi:hypothetical protein
MHPEEVKIIRSALIKFSLDLKREKRNDKAQQIIKQLLQKIK